jgi:hypothetical protein
VRLEGSKHTFLQEIDSFLRIEVIVEDHPRNTIRVLLELLLGEVLENGEMFANGRDGDPVLLFESICVGDVVDGG